MNQFEAEVQLRKDIEHAFTVRWIAFFITCAVIAIALVIQQILYLKCY